MIFISSSRWMHKKFLGCTNFPHSGTFWITAKRKKTRSKIAKNKAFEKRVHFCWHFMVTSYFASSTTLLQSPVCASLQGSQSERGSKVDDLTKVQLSLTNCPVRGPYRCTLKSTKKDKKGLCLFQSKFWSSKWIKLIFNTVHLCIICTIITKIDKSCF